MAEIFAVKNQNLRKNGAFWWYGEMFWVIWGNVSLIIGDKKKWLTKLRIEASSCSLNFFVVWMLLSSTRGLPEKISAQLVEKWLRYWQLKVCGGGGVVGWVPVHRLVTATVRFGCDNLSFFLSSHSERPRKCGFSLCVRLLTSVTLFCRDLIFRWKTLTPLSFMLPCK